MDYLLNRLMPYSLVVILWLVPSFVSVAQGIWQTIGYGYVFDLSSLESPIVYDIGDNHCLPNHFLTAEVAQNGVAIDETTKKIDFDKLFPLAVIKLDSLPKSCANSALTTFKDDGYIFSAKQVLNVFFDNFSQQYAFSSDKNIDWTSVKVDWLKQVNENTTPHQLQLIIDKFLAVLRDGHAILFDQSINRLSHYPPRESDVNRRLHAFYNQHPDYSNIAEVYRFIYSSWIQIVRSYFDKDFPLSQPHANYLYAKLKGNISYLRIDSFDEYETEQVMQGLVPQFNYTNGLVIDLRDSDGGSDNVALKLSSFLIDKPLLVGTKNFSLHMPKSRQTTTSIEQDIVVYPSFPTPYMGKIVVITSQHTPSAAEVFLLAMLARKDTSLIGENSFGAFSDALTKALPNGWGMTLSNERYTALNGKNFEFMGIPVSKRFEFPNISDIEQNRDSALEHAIGLLTRSKPAS